MRVARGKLGVVLALGMSAAVVCSGRAAAAAPGGGAHLTLAENGRSDYRIAVPASAAPTVKHAADELRDYLQRVTGARVAVGEAGNESGPVIRLRRDAAADTGEEGFAIDADRERLVISAATPRGLLYGVDYFLEHYLGVRWYTPEYTRVPHRSSVRVNVVDERQQPAFAYREVFARGADNPSFSAHNRLNGRFGHRLVKEPGQRPEAFVPLRHVDIFDLVPPKRYRRSHPGYFAGGQLRFANPKVQRRATEAVRRLLEKWPDDRPYYLLIAHADRDTYYKGGRDGELIDRFAAPSAAYIDFVRHIAKAVSRSHPNVTVLAQAYLWSRKPPRGMSLPDNMGIMFSGIERDHSRPLSSDANAGVLRDLKGWSGITSKLLLWTYHTDFGNYLQPYPDLATLGPDARTLQEVPHVTGWFAQGAYNTRGAAMQPLRTWVLAQLMWDPDRDPEALTRDFLDGYYGAAAPLIADYLHLLEQSADATRQPLGTKVPPTAAYLTAGMLRKADRLFARAEQAVAGDAARLRHVRTARMSVDYAILASQPAASGLAWVRHDQRLARLKRYVEASGMRAYREGRGNPPKALFHVLAINRSQASKPAVCRGRPAEACRSVQDSGFDLAGGAALVEDDAASDRAAARQAGGRRAWGIQLPLSRILPPDGHWQLYLSVRVAQASGGALFNAGVYPGPKRSFTAGDLSGGGYAWVKLPGSWQAGANRRLWVAPAGGRHLDALYVDRIVAVREGGS